MMPKGTISKFFMQTTEVNLVWIAVKINLQGISTRKYNANNLSLILAFHWEQEYASMHF
jgi:hypothetical protein